MAKEPVTIAEEIEVPPSWSTRSPVPPTVVVVAVEVATNVGVSRAGATKSVVTPRFDV